jgi:hypothetical protein
LASSLTAAAGPPAASFIIRSPITRCDSAASVVVLSHNLSIGRFRRRSDHFACPDASSDLLSLGFGSFIFFFYVFGPVD